MAAPLRHLDVCAGLGGFSLGLRLALGAGVRTVGFVERQAYCCAVLLARMADATLDRAPVFCGDLRDVDGRELRGEVDIVTAGFPCQPWSSAGKRLGEHDERWIWPDIAQLIAAVEPSAVLLENVAPAALRAARDDLRGMGFDTRPGDGPLRIAAEDVGAPHRRARYFLLAHTDGALGRFAEQRGPARRSRRVRDEGRAVARHDRAAVGDSVGARLQGADAEAFQERGKPRVAGDAMAHAGRERSAPRQAHEPWSHGSEPAGEGLADTALVGCASRSATAGGGSRPRPLDGGEALAHANGAGLPRVGLAQHAHEQGACGDLAPRHGADWCEPWPPGPGGDWSIVPAEAQPGFPGAADGAAARMERLHALGNGVVPQVVAAAWRLLTR